MHSSSQGALQSVRWEACFVTVHQQAMNILVNDVSNDICERHTGVKIKWSDRHMQKGVICIRMKTDAVMMMMSNWNVIR